jgi:uncharacterized protein
MEFVYELLTPQVCTNLGILALAAFIQATVGFAAAIVGLPLLLWAGNDLVSSQIMIISAMLPQNILSVWKLRHSIDYAEVVLPASIRIAALPIGVAGLAVVMTWSPAQINQLVGGIILMAVAMQSLAGIEWKNARWWPWLLLTFGGSGILQGLSGMSGPPMVLWVHGQRYSADRARAFLFAMYISNFLPQLGLVWWRFGAGVPKAAFVGMIALPLVLVSAILGLKLGSRLGDRWLRPLTYAALVLLAVKSLLDPWWP